MHVAINDSKHDKSIGGRTVHAGESRMIEDSEIAEALGKGMKVPGYTPRQPEAAPEETPVRERSTEALLEKTVKELTALLPELTDVQVFNLDAAEKKADDPRVTLLREIEDEMIRRSEEDA